MSAVLGFVGAVLGAGASVYGAQKASESASKQRTASRKVFGTLQSNAVGLLPAVQQNMLRNLGTLNERTDNTVANRVANYNIAEDRAYSRAGFANVSNNMLDASLNQFSGLDTAYQSQLQGVFNQAQTERDAIERTYYDAAAQAGRAGVTLGMDFNQAVKDQYGGNV